MEVKVEPFRAFDIVTKKPRDTGQYVIKVDGQTVGFLSYFDNAPIRLHERRSPMEQVEIFEAVCKQVYPQKVAFPVQPPKPPQPKQEKPKIILSDFQ